MLVDDHALFREGLSGIIESQPDMQVVGEAEDGLEALVIARELQPDLVLMDIQMPSFDGLEAARQINKELPDTIIVMLTVQNDEEKLFEAIKNGAKGYLLKNISSNEMLDLLRGVMRGEAAISPTMAGQMLDEFRRLSQPNQDERDEPNVDLTQREQEVLGLVAQGMSDKRIAAELSISIHTVKSHLRNILSKLQVNSRREAARIAKSKGLF
jgi:two-component system NarL family response regulator